MARWDDAQYLKFGDERTRAARELMARVPLAAAELVIDLGCGPGNSTALLRERFPGAELVGVDSSAEMIARARQELPGVRFVQANVEDFRSDRPAELLFANAVFHWLPGHGARLRELFDELRPGGVLAVQMPCNFAEPSHVAMRELAARFGETASNARGPSPVEAPGYYYDLLAGEAEQVDVWRTVYEHVLPDAKAIVEWVKGTGLRPFLEALGEAERRRYLAEYEARMAEAYPPRADGRRLFTFPRLFVVAVRRG